MDMDYGEERSRTRVENMKAVWSSGSCAVCLAVLFLLMGWSIVDPVLPLEQRVALFGVALSCVIGLGLSTGKNGRELNKTQHAIKQD